MNLTGLLPILTILVLSTTADLYAQSLSAKVVDSINGNPVPYATIILNKSGIITNDEGRFNFLLDETIKETDTLYISCIGYQSVARPIHQFTEPAIYLSPKAIELREVIVSNKNYTADEIIEFVADNLEKNYKNDLSKKRLFHRESNASRWFKSDFKVTKSSIAVLNQQFLDSVIATVPKDNTVYNEIAGDFYGNNDRENQKLNLLKASELYDKSKELDFEKLEEKFNSILKENVKDGSYFKIKSGILSFKVDADEVSELFEEEIDSTDVTALNKELEEKKKSKEEEKENYAKWKRNKLAGIFNSLPTQKGADLNVITKSRKYEFTLKEFTYLGNDAVYVIGFVPDGSADYQGKLYINADDFAVLRIDFENVKPVKKFNLLGLSSNKYLSKGTIIYSRENNGAYGLRYFESETGTTIGLKRPLKIIEKNKIVKGRNKQNELAGKMDFGFNYREKNQVVVFESETISQSAFDAFTESNTVLPTYMPNYDPEFWKGFTIIEPNTAIKDFTSVAKD